MISSSRLDAGASVADLAKGLIARREDGDGITRNGGGGVPPAVGVAAFNLLVDKAGAAATPDGRVVFKVTKDEVPPFDPSAEGVKALSEQLRQGLQNGVALQYIEALKQKLGVSRATSARCRWRESGG